MVATMRTVQHLVLTIFCTVCRRNLRTQLKMFSCLNLKRISDITIEQQKVKERGPKLYG